MGIFIKISNSVETDPVLLWEPWVKKDYRDNRLKKLTYIISDIDKALAFEWIAEKLDHSTINLSFILIIQKSSKLEFFLKQLDIPVYCFYYRSKKDFPFIFPRLYILLKRLNPDAVHCHLLYGSLLGLTAAWLAGIKKRIYTRHHSDFHHRYLPGGVKWDKWCNRLSTRIVAPSTAVKEVLVEMEGVLDDRITVIPHGFDLSYFRNPGQERVEALREKYAVGNRYPVIGVISRFTELKGIQFIIPAFVRLLKSYPNALILFFNAAGDYESHIKELLKNVPESNYRLIPFENDLAAVYQLFDIFIQASTDTRIESFGQTYVEALASGVPSVFTLSGIAPDFIEHENNALVIPFRDSDAIYRSIRRILEVPDLKEKLIAEGWESVKKRFALQLMIDKLEELYHAE